jgi:hypothetical protein
VPFSSSFHLSFVPVTQVFQVMVTSGDRHNKRAAVGVSAGVIG